MPRPDRKPGAPASPSASPARPLLLAIVVLAVLGLGAALELTSVHWLAHHGRASVCDLNDVWSCSDVALSSWSTLLGVPLATWGALAYLAVLALGVAGLRAGRGTAHAGYPGGILVGVTGFMSAMAVALAYVSEAIIQKFCLFCLFSWTVSLALLVLSILLARRGGGFRAALAADLAVVRRAPRGFVTGVAVLGVLALALLAGYPAIAKQGAATGPVATTGPSATPAPTGAPGSAVVYEYSDYQCPFCAQVNERLRPILPQRPDLRLVRRHWPLDQSCNPVLKRQMHEGSCDMARAAICAESMNRFEELDQALFANLAVKDPLDDVIARAGLDPAKVRACMASPATEQRLQSDIAEANRLGIHSTPSFVYEGKLYAGEPPAVLGIR